MELIDKIKAIAKDGVDFKEIETELMGMNPLNGIKSKEDAWSFIKTNDYLLSAFDMEQSKRAEKVLENYKTGRMQEEWKAKEAEIIAKIQPNETAAEKVAREFAEYKLEVKAKEDRARLQDDLSIKAKELDFDPMKARELSIYGEKAIDKLEQEASWINKEVERRVSEQIKGVYKTATPRTAANINSLDTLSDAELHRAALDNPTMKQAVLEEVKKRAMIIK